ncbi:MAG: hypothetical protein BWK76_26985 [Desulfobulbaceae bacterium A2]|nr:MAG: hypothetical protein BWK76_26985 [Desulfobulbaceae bacterium A2]
MRSMIGVLVLGCLVAGVPVHAASFDCTKATTEVEKLICGNEWASRKDEELARVYAEALAKSAEPEKLQAGQVAWLEERNRCADIECISKITQYRIEQIHMLTAKPGQSGTAATGRLRFQFCENRPSLTCEYPGRGFSVCEAYLKHLNAMPEDWQRKHGACVPWIDPAKGDFTLPDWQSLDIRDHLSWIYEIIRIRFMFQDKQLPPFEEWRGRYEGRIERGEISPCLQLVRLELVKGSGQETLLKFHEGDPVMSGCKDGVPANPSVSGGSTGDTIFLLRDETGAPKIEEIAGIHWDADMLLFREQPIFLYQYDHSNKVGWYVSIYFPTAPYPNNPKHYFVPLRCEFIDTLYGRRSTK